MDGLGIIMTLIVGGVAGWLASLVMNTDHQQGLLLNIVVGIIGAFVGSFVFGLLGLGVEGNILGNLVVATVGAIILLAIVKAVRK